MVVGEEPIEIKILDFGIVTLLEGDEAEVLRTKVGSIRGTPSYMAPELFSGTVRASVESDIFAVGLVLAECITGTVCVSGTSLMQIAYKQVHEPLKLPGFIPTDLANVILKCCEKQATQRYHAPGEVIDALLEALPLAIAQRDKYEAAYLESIRVSSSQSLSNSLIIDTSDPLERITNPSTSVPSISRNWFFVFLTLVGILGVLVGGFIFLYLEYRNDGNNQVTAAAPNSVDQTSEGIVSSEATPILENTSVSSTKAELSDNNLAPVKQLDVLKSALEAAASGVAKALTKDSEDVTDPAATENLASASPKAKSDEKPQRVRKTRTPKAPVPAPAIIEAPAEANPAPASAESSKNKYKGIPVNLLD